MFIFFSIHRQRGVFYMAAKFASFVQLQKSEKLLQKNRIYLLQINEKKFHLPKHTKYSKEGISCLLYVNNIKL